MKTTSGDAPTDRSGGASGTAGPSGSPAAGYQIVTGNVRVVSPVEVERVGAANVSCVTPTRVWRSTTSGPVVLPVVVVVGSAVVGGTVAEIGGTDVDVARSPPPPPPPPHAVRTRAASTNPPTGRTTRPKLPRHARRESSGHAAGPWLRS